MQIKIYNKSEQEKNPNFLSGVLVPDQTHSSNIIEVISGKEDLSDCDGIFTSKKNNFKLAVKTADCSAIVFEDKDYYGIVHAGWRGAVNGIIEKMMQNFQNPKIFVAPFYKKFEIKKDFCYDKIYEKFGEKFFEPHPQPLPCMEGSNKLLFDFEGALRSILGDKAIFDERDTFENENFYSWRREKNEKRNYNVIFK